MYNHFWQGLLDRFILPYLNNQKIQNIQKNCGENAGETSIGSLPVLLARLQNTALSFYSVILLCNFERFCYAAFAPKHYPATCLRGCLSLREAFSCDREFIKTLASLYVLWKYKRHQ